MTITTVADICLSVKTLPLVYDDYSVQFIAYLRQYVNAGFRVLFKLVFIGGGYRSVHRGHGQPAIPDTLKGTSNEYGFENRHRA
jgi:hypothetical protein